MLLVVSSKNIPPEAPPAAPIEAAAQARPETGDLADIRGRLARIRAELARRREATASSNERLERAQRLFTTAQSQVEDAEEVRARVGGDTPVRKRTK